MICQVFRIFGLHFAVSVVIQTVIFLGHVPGEFVSSSCGVVGAVVSFRVLSTIKAECKSKSVEFSAK